MPINPEFIASLEAEFAADKDQLAKGMEPLKPFIPRAIHFSMPCHDKRMHCETHLHLSACIRQLEKLGFVCEEARSYAGGICDARINAMHEFMKSQNAPEAFVFLDSDLKFSWDAMRRLIFNPYPVAMGIYPIKRLNFERVKRAVESGSKNWKFECLDYPVNLPAQVRRGEARPDLYPGGYVHVESGPTGFMRIKREVFGRMRIDNPDLQYEIDDGTIRHALFNFDRYYDVERGKRVQQSEDLTFCKLAAKSGFKAYADIRTPLTHCGDFEFEGFWGALFGDEKA